MVDENHNLMEDLNLVGESSFIQVDKLQGKTILVTGATGLIGRNLVTALVYLNKLNQLDLRVIAQIRNPEKARSIWGENCSDIKFVVGDVRHFLKIKEPIDCIIHAASETSSKAFVSKPAEVLLTALVGTKNILELAKNKKVDSVVFLSTMEVYGFPEKGSRVSETSIGAFIPQNVRNCYPVGKIAAESLCSSYASEYGLPVKVLRLTQTFGKGVSYNDGRIFAYLARCAIEGKDIVLKTKGETERSYLYTMDAVTAILTVLLNGDSGEAYTAADEATYCSIADMARLIASDNGIKVKFEIDKSNKSGFADTLYMNLDTSKLMNLGWKTQVHKMKDKACHPILDLYRLMIDDMKTSR